MTFALTGQQRRRSPTVASDRIAPISSKPGGQSHGRWTTQRWPSALRVPAANSVFDQTGESCAERQVDDTWFLAGSFGPEPVVRSGTIPAGTARLIPLVNYASFAFLSDPPALALGAGSAQAQPRIDGIWEPQARQRGVSCAIWGRRSLRW